MIVDDIQPEDRTHIRAISRGIREARERAGLTQEQLAARLGVRQSAVSHWERDKNPTAANVFRIADALGVTPDVIFRYLLQGELGPEPLHRGGRGRGGRSRP